MRDRQHALQGHPQLPPLYRPELLHPKHPGVQLLLRPLACLMQVSAFAADVDAAARALARVVDQQLPAPHRSSGTEQRSLRTVGPGVWHLVGDGVAPWDAVTLRAALSGVATLVDLSHARVAFVLHGLAANRVLAQFCALDLDVSRFPTGSVTPTRFGHVGAALARIGDGPSFELHVARGYAGFVLESLLLAVREFDGLPGAMPAPGAAGPASSADP